ncbi:tyrosine-type recombinase/integrase [Flavobacterium sp.]|uniref:tyrosine-type recombinase/integrase n=1 Tax=Flavobacterium sp. TaxID=239 RepID=UPI0026110FFF|nr:tyrosine-type recombinase/integrase [Flavobacterium sp.]MDD3004466.1 tyrosine-type recombinase/integrase [Flavobacterium sp.]
MKFKVQAFIDYLSHEKHYSLHTIKAYENDLSDFSLFVKNDLGEDDLVKVNYGQIRSWIVSLVDQNISAASVNRKIASLKAFYKFLLKSKQIGISPLVKHKSLKAAKKIQIPFSVQEVQKVLTSDFFDFDFEGIRDELIVNLFYATGVRRAELIELKLADVDLSNGVIKVLGKRNKERLVPVVSEINCLVKAYLEQRSLLEVVQDEQFFFLTKKGKKLNVSLVYRVINSYFSNVTEKVKKSPHIMRHSFATHLLNNGADINSVKDLLGHSSLASTQVYTHNSLSELKRVHGVYHPRQKK